MTGFGPRLKYLRNRQNLSQEQLGKLFNLSKSAIGMYERGQREPSLKDLKRMAQYFHVSIDFLLDHNIESDNNSFPTLNKDELRILELSQEHPLLFEFLLNASGDEINKMIKIFKILNDGWAFIQTFNELPIWQPIISYNKKIYLSTLFYLFGNLYEVILCRLLVNV